MLNQQLVQEKIIDYCSVHCAKYQIDNHNAEECQNCPLYDAKMELMSWENYFVITTVHRDDLEGQGFDISNVDDDMMKELADKMADAYNNRHIWKLRRMRG